VRMLRRPGSVQEGSLVCALVSLLSLYRGADCTDFFELFEKPLQQLVDGKGDDWEALRLPALSSLCFVAFVCGSGRAHRSTMDFLLQVALFESLETSGVVHYSSALKAKAMDGFVLLGSTMSELAVVERCREDDLIDLLLAMLQRDVNDIVSILSAGRAMAFLWECATGVFVEDHTTVDEPSALLSDNSITVDETLDGMGLYLSLSLMLICNKLRCLGSPNTEIRRIAKDSSKKVSKRNKKEQRAEFRDILELLDDGTSPVEVIRMQGADVEVEGFAQACVVEVLREVLGSGFHSSLHAFDVVK
jgi:hypothetical protein